MTKGDARAIANGLFPGGQDIQSLTRQGRDEVREAVEVMLKVWDRNNVKLQLALQQLDKAADEIERLKRELAQAQCEESKD